MDGVTGAVVASFRFENALQEIFAVQVVPGLAWPDVVNDDLPLLADTFMLPAA